MVVVQRAVDERAKDTIEESAAPGVTRPAPRTPFGVRSPPHGDTQNLRRPSPDSAYNYFRRSFFFSLHCLRVQWEWDGIRLGFKMGREDIRGGRGWLLRRQEGFDTLKALTGVVLGRKERGEEDQIGDG